MNIKDTLYSSFSFDWVVKSVPYSIKFKRAFEVNEIDEIFCAIINTKGGVVDRLEFGALLGFNLYDAPEEGRYLDLAEEAIFNQYLKETFEYNLIKEEDGLILITDSGIDSLTSKLKYKYFDARASLFENVSAKGEKVDFSFLDVFNIKGDKTLVKLEKTETEISDESIKNKLQFQLFQNDVFQGDLLQVFKNESSLKYHDYNLTCQLKKHQDTFKISVFYNGVEKPELENIVYQNQNYEFLEELIFKGRFHRVIDSKSPINPNIIYEFQELWNWSKLAENANLNWGESEVFKIFKENSDGSTWRVISKKAPIDSIKLNIEDYLNYWDWRVLSQKLDDEYILETIDRFKWDFEELSQKNNNFIIKLLKIDKFKNENWDWQLLTETLPNNFIIDNINTLSWDFYLLTTLKFEVFKQVFNANIDDHIKKYWNWAYISKEISITYLYKNIFKFSGKINWDIVLERFFNDKEILNKCLDDDDFKLVLKTNLPEYFSISHQNYFWSEEVISFFDKLNLINWETTSYSKGFDTNVNVDWTAKIFDKFSHNIISEKGYTNVSSLISDNSLLLKDFNWDWEAISINKTIISDGNFITKVITEPISILNNFEWGSIYHLHSLPFWNNFLLEFHKNTQNENTKKFWKQITIDEEINFILSHGDLPWDWVYVTGNASVKLIIDSLEEEQRALRWDWDIATRKLDKKTIIEYLELGAKYWDWNYIIKDLFSVGEELRIEGGELQRIALSLSVLDKEKKNEFWKTLTAVFSFKKLYNYIEITTDNIEFEWDWDTISAEKHLPTDLVSLYNFRNKLNWTILSSCEAIQKKFSYSIWGKDRKGCSLNIIKYLKTFKDNWDWKILSRNKDLNWDRRLLRSFRGANWDWEYLSEFGGFLRKEKNDDDSYLLNLFFQFPYIDFGVFSKRQDLKITREVILKYKDSNWDWGVLSRNSKVDINSDLLTELKNKNWDWDALSARKDIELNNELILSLLGKDWSWSSLSSNPCLVFDTDFISRLSSKPLDWVKVTKHNTFAPSVQNLSKIKNQKLDWNHLSERPDLNLTNELLAKFEDKWDWYYITRQPELDFSDVNLLDRFVDKWDWSFICEKSNFTLNSKNIKIFKNHLDWNLISSNTNLEYTKELILEYKPYWNWNKLKQNARIIELFGDFIETSIAQSPKLTFIDKIEDQYSSWSGSIYHFSHIENAVGIIKNRKIQSRNRAIIHGDAAGNVVHRRSDAHEYARFYFRPHTPTQFYNEFLGKNINDGYNNHSTGARVSWYEKARGLGFPKCPIPVFFRFSIKEVLLKNNNSCNISDGNMQTGATTFGPIELMIDKFGFEDLFYMPEQYATREDYNKYRDYSQQEFLVKDELYFDDLIDFEIVCPSLSDKELLISLIGNENKDVFSKIIVDGTYYNNENPRISVDKSENKLFIRSEFEGNGYLNLYTGSSIDPSNIENGDVEKNLGNKIIFKSYLSLNNYIGNFKLTFIDESKREWFIYQNNKVDVN